MKNTPLKILLGSLLLLMSCIQESQDSSRQFEEQQHVTALSLDKKEFKLNVRCLYILSLEKSFDTKGYFIDKKDSVEILIEPILRSAIRAIVQKYTLKELYAKDRSEIERELFDEARAIILQTDTDSNIKIQINHIFLTKMDTKMNDKTPKVTGIGGIFFRSKDPKAVKEWYGKNLGLAITEHGSPFEFRNANRPEEINYLNWSPFSEKTDYFEPSEKEFMINYRVQNIEGLVKNLKENGVTIVDKIETYSYGKFVHIMDLEGNKIELWEPIDSVFTQMGGPTTK